MKQSQLNELKRSLASIAMSSGLDIATNKIQAEIRRRNAMRVSRTTVGYIGVENITYTIPAGSVVLSSTDRYTLFLSYFSQRDSSEQVSWFAVPSEFISLDLIKEIKGYIPSALPFSYEECDSEFIYVGLPNHKIAFCQDEEGNWQVDEENTKYLPFHYRNEQEEGEEEYPNFLGESTLRRLQGEPTPMLDTEDDAIEYAARQPS